MAQSHCLAHMFFQCLILMGLYLQELGMFLEIGVFLYEHGALVEKDIDNHQKEQSTTFQKGKKIG